ncbi:hypothetical protein DYB36_012184 [Aphanomyces astaci]|uniref:Transposase Tc1-like domain-containing protein n=1 Tax=Aphanomyces astaci TaxID=112090 RepID=A0A397A5T1_APHAT|nr:hypothetical protein DYB36_012184 [Aphanomyces astaci]
MTTGSCIITKLRGKYYSEDQKHATAISVYQRLHAFKFRPHASLDANLQAFDKLRTRWKSWKGIPSATAIYRGQLQARSLKSLKKGRVGRKHRHKIQEIIAKIREVPQGQRTTMRDLSKATGLSISTLSRALHKGTMTCFNMTMLPPTVRSTTQRSPTSRVMDGRSLYVGSRRTVLT